MDDIGVVDQVGGVAVITVDAPALTRTHSTAGARYLRSVLDLHTVPTGPGSPGYTATLALYPRVFDWADADASFTGAYARGTLLRGGAMADLAVPCSPRPGWSIRDHFYDLADHLQDHGYAPRLRGVAVQVLHDGVPIDLVPTVMTAPLTSDQSIFRHRVGSPIATNLSVHCSYVNTWGYRDEIRALKRWTQVHDVPLPSFLLELIVISAIRRRPPGDLAFNVITVLEHLAERFETERVPDPANPAHNVASELSLADRREVAERARWCLRRARWDAVLH